MLHQGLHLTLLDLIALEQGQATADSWGLATLFVLLLPALLAKLLADCPGKALAEVATESAITMKARSNMLSFGLVSKPLHHFMEIFVIQLDLDFVSFGGDNLNDRLSEVKVRLIAASTAIDCLTVEMLGNIVQERPGSVIHTLERLAHAPVNSDIALWVVVR